MLSELHRIYPPRDNSVLTGHSNNGNDVILTQWLLPNLPLSVKRGSATRQGSFEAFSRDQVIFLQWQEIPTNFKLFLRTLICYASFRTSLEVK